MPDINANAKLLGPVVVAVLVPELPFVAYAMTICCPIVNVKLCPTTAVMTLVVYADDGTKLAVCPTNVAVVKSPL